MNQILFKLDVFEGPLDLLLKLISKHKLNIYDIEISKLLEQYLEYMDECSSQNLETSGEFLEMAAKLIYIKTAYLLPKPESDEADRLKKELETNLIEYSVFKSAAAVLSERFTGDDMFVRRFARIKPLYSYSQLYMPDKLAMTYINMSISENLDIENKIIENKINSAVKKRVTSVISKVVSILRKLYNSKEKLQMNSLYDGIYDRSERVATFLAVLELTKNGRIKISDDDNYISFNGTKKERISKNNGY